MSTLRASILAALTAGREMEQELSRASDDSPPPEAGRWTARDHLAHLAAWREYAATVLDAVRTGAPVPVVADEDERNAEIYAETHGLSAAEVLDRAARSYERLVRALEACSDADLGKPLRSGSDAPVWGVVPGNGEAHVAQHLVYWHLERGDQPAAERVARRLYEVEIGAFPDERHRAEAAYNLGCFYATTGRHDEAIDLVRRALALDPGLRAWAMEDPDLEPIRPLLRAIQEDAMSEQTFIRITHVGTVAVPVTDQERALEFYVRKLGFEKRRDMAFGEGGRWVEVAPAGAATTIALVPPAEGAPAGVETGIRLFSQDAEADHADLRARGVDVDAEVMRFGGGVPPMFYLRDPDGNRLIVVESA